MLNGLYSYVVVVVRDTSIALSEDCVKEACSINKNVKKNHKLNTGPAKTMLCVRAGTPSVGAPYFKSLCGRNAYFYCRWRCKRRGSASGLGEDNGRLKIAGKCAKIEQDRASLGSLCADAVSQTGSSSDIFDFGLGKLPY